MAKKTTTTTKKPRATTAKTKKISTKKSAATNKSTSTRSPLSAVKRVFASDLAGLRKFNLLMALLHAAQGIAVLALSRNVTFPVTTNYLTTDSLANADGSASLVPATRLLFDINLAYLIAAFFFMSALAHLVIATINRSRYESDLNQGVNRHRWVEYSISASTMMVAIGFLTGIYDLSTHIMIFTLIMVMNLLGLVMELSNRGNDKPNWLSYIVGCIAGIVPWIVFGIYVWGIRTYGEGQIPSFVYWIYASIFVLFFSFAVNMYLQYKKKGKWANYLYGERAYIILSLVAKSALAWQVFAGTLRP